MDREIPNQLRQRRRVRRVATAIVAAGAALFFLAMTVSWLKPSVRRRDLLTARVTRGTVEGTLQAAGTVVPAGRAVPATVATVVAGAGGLAAGLLLEELLWP